jgi:hypothetical protein
LVGDNVDDGYAQAMDLVYTTESTTYRTNKFHELIELSRANSTELVRKSYNTTNSNRATTILIPSHTIHTLQARIQHSPGL